MNDMSAMGMTSAASLDFCMKRLQTTIGHAL